MKYWILSALCPCLPISIKALHFKTGKVNEHLQLPETMCQMERKSWVPYRGWKNAQDFWLVPIYYWNGPSIILHLLWYRTSQSICYSVMHFFQHICPSTLVPCSNTSPRDVQLKDEGFLDFLSFTVWWLCLEYDSHTDTVLNHSGHSYFHSKMNKWKAPHCRRKIKDVLKIKFHWLQDRKENV